MLSGLRFSFALPSQLFAPISSSSPSYDFSAQQNSRCPPIFITEPLSGGHTVFWDGSGLCGKEFLRWLRDACVRWPLPTVWHVLCGFVGFYPDFYRYAQAIVLKMTVSLGARAPCRLYAYYDIVEVHRVVFHTKSNCPSAMMRSEASTSLAVTLCPNEQSYLRKGQWEISKTPNRAN